MQEKYPCVDLSSLYYEWVTGTVGKKMWGRWLLIGLLNQVQYIAIIGEDSPPQAGSLTPCLAVNGAKHCRTAAASQRCNTYLVHGCWMGAAGCLDGIMWCWCSEEDITLIYSLVRGWRGFIIVILLGARALALLFTEKRQKSEFILNSQNIWLYF